MKSLLLCLTLIVPSLLFAQSGNQERLRSIKNLHRIALASCNKHTEVQDVWKELILARPGLFIWGGDNVYSDTDNPDDLRVAYEYQNSVEDYRDFKSRTPVIGNWDDHDYGQNDGNGFYKHKKMSQKHLLDFLEEPLDSPRRRREGIYTSYTFGEAEKKIKIIILDNRYFKGLERDAPLLGSVQWAWLEDELKHSDASLHLINSGLAITSPVTPISEEWADYPGEVRRLKELLKTYHIKAPVFLSGDKHFTSIMNFDGHLEFMASGMTHNTRVAFRPYVYAKFPKPVFEHNFGLIDIDWADTAPVLTLTVRTSAGIDRIIKKVRWADGNWQNVH